MNNSKNKAFEICLKYQKLLFINISDKLEDQNYIHPDSIKCALILVNELLESSPSCRYWNTYDDETPSAIIFWNEVKRELEILLESK